MINPTRISFSCLSLSIVLALSACSDEPDPDGPPGEGDVDAAPIDIDAAPIDIDAAPIDIDAAPVDIDAAPDDDGMARFATASPEQLQGVFDHAVAVDLIRRMGPIQASTYHDGDCPEMISEGDLLTNVNGNGCTTGIGILFDGSFELPDGYGAGFSSIIYRGYRMTDNLGDSVSLDGRLEFVAGPEDALAYDLDVTMEGQTEGEPASSRVHAEMSASCTTQSATRATCTLAEGSKSFIEGLGHFTITGTHGVGGDGSDTSMGGDGAELSFQGADTMEATYDAGTGCTEYRIAGGPWQTHCPE